MVKRIHLELWDWRIRQSKKQQNELATWQFPIARSLKIGNIVAEIEPEVVI